MVGVGTQSFRLIEGLSTRMGNMWVMYVPTTSNSWEGIPPVLFAESRTINMSCVPA